MREEALKLADSLDLFHTGEVFQESADMIRKLVAEVQKEKAKTRILANSEVEQSHLTSNESISQPVAWMMTRDGQFYDAIHPDEHAKFEGMYTVPLYTAPRELSDEEAIKLWDSIPLVPNEGMTGRLKLFARAILKKAQNK